MKPPLLTSLIAAGLGPVAAVIWAARSDAALPPQYDRWNEFAAIVADNSIPEKLGTYSPADQIERVSDLSYRVHGGKCVVAVRLAKRAPTGPQGQPMIGASVISIADVGEPRCA
jgi:hypothetical protein